MVFIIGNGFDIALGLKTSYRDFLKWYLSQSTIKDEPIIVKFKEEIRNDIDKDIRSWADLEMKLGDYICKYDLHQIKEYEFAYRDIKEKLNRYIKMQERKVKYDTIGTEISEQVKKFFGEFHDYFPPQTRLELINSIYPRIGSMTYNFINFNYTQTLAECLAQGGDTLKYRTHNRDVVDKIVHIHGQIDNNLLLGVDNESQINNDIFRNDLAIKRLLLKPLLNESSKYGTADEVRRIISNSNTVCLFGLSLGGSDLSWWVYIGKWLKTSEQKKLIVFWYEYEDAHRLNLHGDIRLALEDKVIMHFTKQAGFS
ncbi:MAG: bacteriophage abortive infection AbiH family protein, partial [Firmicutes bacterium]|nr:bacteriophage abortive infection AbiH family protein [Bacillota bacterium]